MSLRTKWRGIKEILAFDNRLALVASKLFFPRERLQVYRQNGIQFLSDHEWDFWYGGRPAAVPMLDAFGDVVGHRGMARFGGGMWDRLGRIACWNTLMDEHDYLDRRWEDLRTA